MLKALFLDMDETLCDTLGANEHAKTLMVQELEQQFGPGFNGYGFADAYVTGIYRKWTEYQRARYLPIIEQQSEGAFRLQLIRDLLVEQGVNDSGEAAAQTLRDNFDSNRLQAFDFYPGIAAFLAEARKLFTLVVITNGPEFSQIPKIEAIDLAEHVDHIIVGGQEPEQKPARSIFDKALKLANCEAHEAIHVGDSLATDVAGAHNSGITTVWIQHQQPLDAELGIDPHHTVLHPSEIPALIRELHTTTGERPVFSETCASLLKKHLTEDVWRQLANTETANGYFFMQAIRSGVEQQDSSIGVYAGDEESYQLFAPLLEPIIHAYHGSAGPHPASDFSDAKLPAVSSQATDRIVSSRIRVGRNLAGFPLGPGITRAQRQLVEAQITNALADLPAPLDGDYFPLSGMEEDFRSDLVARHLLFKSEDRFLESAGLMRDWPEARGIYISRDESFCVWVNEEDQLRIIAMKKGGDAAEVFRLLAIGVRALSKQLEFLTSAAYGNLASCPSNLGTAMRASVHMKLAALGANEKELQVLADALGLQVRGIHGEHSQSSGGVFDISNRMRLGVTEAEALGHLIRGVNQLAERDAAMQI